MSVLYDPIIPKLDYMQLWFYNWLMIDKEYPIDKIVRIIIVGIKNGSVI